MSARGEVSFNLSTIMTERILITGGAGFIGSNLALSFKRDRPSATIIAFDNLKRRGSELALSRLRARALTKPRD